MSPTEEQRLSALELANKKRIRKAELRRRLASERGVLRDVLLNPPPELEHLAIVDVVRLAYSKPRQAASVSRLGRLALRDGVNLLMPLGQASLRTRQWAAQHAEWNWTASPTQHPAIVVIDEA